MTEVKNIIFDLGGIFMNINYQLTEDAFVQLGVTKFPELYTQHHVTPLFEDFETGKITPEQFCDEFRALAKSSLNNQKIFDAWNAMLLDFPKERIDWLNNISKKYKVFLFSNTNKIHLDFFNKVANAVTKEKAFNSYFIKTYYSHEMGMRKPYKASFIKILEEQKLIAEETLFIDDTLKNIDGAKQAGLQTILLLPPKTVLQLDL